jgi:hypothetical protein
MTGDLFDHLAEHMLFLSTATSFWYSLNSNYDHGLHLSQQLGMTLQDNEYLLVAANLVHNHPKWGFTILVYRLKIFFVGCCFYKSDGTGSFEVVSKKFDLDACILGTTPKHKMKVHVFAIRQSTNC